MSQSLSRTRLAAGVGIASLAALSVVALLASVFVGVARSADPPLSPPVGEPQGDVRCTGTVVNVSVDNVVVPQGSTCFLAGTQVRGSVLAEPQSLLFMGAGTGVRGNVELKEGATLFADGVRVGGNLKCDGCQRVSVGRSAADGNFEAVGARSGGVSLSTTDVGGEVEVAGAAGHVSILVSGVGGNLRLEKNGGDVFVQNTTVAGNLQAFEGLHGFLGANRVGGNMQVFKNRGAPTLIVANTIAQALQCQDNEPPPVAFINAARSFEGQCGPPS